MAIQFFGIFSTHGIFVDTVESLHDILTSIDKMASGNMKNLRLCEKLSLILSILILKCGVQCETTLTINTNKRFKCFKTNKTNKAFKRFETSDQYQQLLHQLPTNQSPPYIDTPKSYIIFEFYVCVCVPLPDSKAEAVILQFQFQIISDFKMKT